MNVFFRIGISLYLVGSFSLSAAESKQNISKKRPKKSMLVSLVEISSVVDILQILNEEPETPPVSPSQSRVKKRQKQEHKVRDRPTRVSHDAIEYDFSEIRYPYLSKIILQKNPQKTLTIVLQKSYKQIEDQRKAYFFLERFKNFLKIQTLFKRFIRRTEEHEEHSRIEHYSCDNPYINHLHFELTEVTQRLMAIFVNAFGLESFKTQIERHFTPLYD